MTGSLHITDHTGHSTLTWDTAAPETVEEVREKFDQIVAEGMSVFCQDEGKEARVKTFDPSAQTLIATRPLQGG